VAKVLARDIDDGDRHVREAAVGLLLDGQHPGVAVEALVAQYEQLLSAWNRNAPLLSVAFDHKKVQDEQFAYWTYAKTDFAARDLRASASCPTNGPRRRCSRCSKSPSTRRPGCFFVDACDALTRQGSLKGLARRGRVPAAAQDCDRERQDRPALRTPGLARAEPRGTPCTSDTGALAPKTRTTSKPR
jgi:hypothetical protein